VRRWHEEDQFERSADERKLAMGDVGPMILWMSVARTKTPMIYQKRVKKTKRIRRRLSGLSRVYVCVSGRHDLFLFQVSRYPNSPIPFLEICVDAISEHRVLVLDTNVIPSSLSAFASIIECL